MTEDRSGGIASFGVSFGNEKKGQGGGESAEDRSFRLAVVAEVVPGPEWSTGRTPPVDLVRIDTQTFDAVMAQLAPSLGIEVDDPFGAREPSLRIDLVLRDRKAMRPNEIVEQVPVLRALVDARRVVQDLATGKASIESARGQLARILPRASWADALLSEVRDAPPAAPPTPAAQPARAPAHSPSPGGNGGKAGIDALLDMVDVPTEPAPPSVDPGATVGDFSRVVAAVARSARPGVRRAIVGTAPQRLEHAFRNLLDSILRHPEFRRLESTWRGLRLLVENCDRKAGVEVDVVCAGRDAVVDALRKLAEGDPERPPVDLVVIDQRIEPTAVDLALLEKWSGLAEMLLAPIVLAGHPGLLGADSLERVARSTGLLSASDDARAVALRGLAAHEASRWVSLVVNDPVVRLPHTKDSSRQQQPPFEEDAHDLDAHVFASGAYVVAALCARSHARLRWPTAIVGPRDGALGGFLVHTVQDRGEEAAIPLQVVPSEDAVRDAAKGGVTVLTCAPNSDTVVLSRAPVLHRSGGGNGPSSATLGDQLFVGLFARAVQQVAAAIPADTPPNAAADVARIALHDLFQRAAPPGPEIVATVDAARGALTVTVRPRRFAGVALEELTLGAALG